MPLKTKRWEDPSDPDDGFRLLVTRYRPRVLAVLGITAWRVAFERPRAVLGVQPERIGGATTWVAPNPSGLNAHYLLPDLAAFYRGLRPVSR